MSPLEQLLSAESRMKNVGARFLMAAGRGYGHPLKKHGHRRGTSGACFRNAFDLARRNPELTYCEGRALSMGIVPIEHAWCIDTAGAVIDITWEPGEQSYHGVAFRSDWLMTWVGGRARYGVLAEMFPAELAELDPLDFLAGPTESELAATRRVLDDVRDILTQRT